MQRSLALALFALASFPPAVRADDITALYPDGANMVIGIDIKGIMDSPLGKKLGGKDKPFDKTRKLLNIVRLLVGRDRL